MPIPRQIVENLKKIIPPLDGSLHKGQSGRVGVLGGAKDYTGAPFFAAISALRLGADLSHVICSPTAAPSIKSYAPDLIVHPILSEDSSPDKIRPELESLLSRLHVLVVGPGLGRETYMQSYARTALSIARSNGMFLVLDADALWMIDQEPELIKGYQRAVLTPNVMEFKRLTDKLGISGGDEKAGMVSRALGGVTIVQKGATDIIAIDTSGSSALSKEQERVDVDTRGGYKRCGGQGDVLSGNIGTMMAWGKCYEGGAYGDGSVSASEIPLLASVGGCIITRTASRITFEKKGRAMITQDMITELGDAFVEVFGSDSQFWDKGKL